MNVTLAEHGDHTEAPSSLHWNVVPAGPVVVSPNVAVVAAVTLAGLTRSPVSGSARTLEDAVAVSDALVPVTRTRSVLPSSSAPTL